MNGTHLASTAAKNDIVGALLALWAAVTHPKSTIMNKTFLSCTKRGRFHTNRSVYLGLWISFRYLINHVNRRCPLFQPSEIFISAPNVWCVHRPFHAMSSSKLDNGYLQTTLAMLTTSNRNEGIASIKPSHNRCLSTRRENRRWSFRKFNGFTRSHADHNSCNDHAHKGQA